jgi:hypothetical protein
MPDPISRAHFIGAHIRHSAPEELQLFIFRVLMTLRTALITVNLAELTV